MIENRVAYFEYIRKDTGLAANKELKTIQTNASSNIRIEMFASPVYLTMHIFT